MKITYKEHKFRESSLEVIEQANQIIREYQAQRLDLTLRQLYYQFVARDLLENTQRSYSRLGSIVNDARLAGMIDWDILEDRTRNLQGNWHMMSPGDAIDDLVSKYLIDKWADQPCRIEVWVEKQALIGVFEQICLELDVDYFACRGFVSQSEMWGASLRMRSRVRSGQRAILLHFGDHDPSGLDMTRDIEDRFKLFGADVSVERVALNMDQIEEFSPPPNFAKVTDSRFEGYEEQYGASSWELDALDPTTLRRLVEHHVSAHRDADLWSRAVAREEEERKQLQWVAENWDDVAALIR